MTYARSIRAVFLALALGLVPAPAHADAPAGPEARVAAALAEAVADRGPWQRDRIVVSEVSLPRDFTLAATDRLMVDLPPRDRLLGRIPFQVRVLGKAAGEPQWATARVEVMVSAVVAARTLGRHQLLEPSLLATAEVPLSRLPAGAATDPEDLLGHRTVRRIGQGRPVTRAMVETPPVVQRGDRVTLVVRSPGLEVTAAGEAAEDGAPDAFIQVLNLRSHRAVQGRVVDAHTVEVVY